MVQLANAGEYMQFLNATILSKQSIALVKGHFIFSYFVLLH